MGTSHSFDSPLMLSGVGKPSMSSYSALHSCRKRLVVGFIHTLCVSIELALHGWIDPCDANSVDTFFVDHSSCFTRLIP